MDLLSLPQQFCLTKLHSFSKQIGIAYTELSQSHKAEENVQFLKCHYFITDLGSYQTNTMQS